MKIMQIIVLIMMLLSGDAFYPAVLTVTAIDHGVVTLQDHEGHEYSIEEAESWRIGNKAACIMYSKGTYNKNDDEILQARYVWEGSEK